MVEGNNPAPTAVAISALFREFRPNYAIMVDSGHGTSGHKAIARAKQGDLRFGKSGSGHVDARLYISTREQDKSRQVTLIQKLLSRKNGIRVLDDLVCSDESLERGNLIPVGDPMPHGYARTHLMLNKTIEQLLNYQRVTRLPSVITESWIDAKSKWSGKVGGMQDDLAMVVCIGILYSSIVSIYKIDNLQHCMTT